MKPIVSPHCRIRHPETFVIGDDSIVDDYCYFSTQITIGRCTHIASGCSIAGGPARQFTIGDFSSLSSGVKIWCASNDYVNDLVSLVPPEASDVQTSSIVGDVRFEHYTGVGSNAVVMPDNHVPEGAVIGALSFVPPAFAFEPWSVYAGTPIRFIRRRNRERVLDQVTRIAARLASRGTEA